MSSLRDLGDEAPEPAHTDLAHLRAVAWIAWGAAGLCLTLFLLVRL